MLSRSKKVAIMINYKALEPGSRSHTHFQTLSVALHPDFDSNCLVAPRVSVESLESLDMSRAVGLESLDMSRAVGRKSLDTPKFGREILDMSLGPLRRTTWLKMDYILLFLS